MEFDKPMPIEAYTNEMVMDCIDLALVRQNQIENELNQLTAEAVKRGLIPKDLPED